MLPQNQTKPEEGVGIYSDCSLCCNGRDAKSAQGLGRLAQTLNLYNNFAHARVVSFDQTNPGTISCDPRILLRGDSRPKQGLPLRSHLIRLFGGDDHLNHPGDSKRSAFLFPQDAVKAGAALVHIEDVLNKE
jgi:hypothetical protein